MKKLLVLLLIAMTTISNAQNPDSKTALIIIDIQEFYFPGGDVELVKPDEASLNAKLLLDYFRKNKMTIVHVKHNYEPGGSIHKNVKPIDGEKVIVKDEVNCFKNTDLLNFLKEREIETTVICGMQTHMCLEAGTRASSDHNFNTIVIHDACTTRDLKFDKKLVKAEDVHYSTLSTLKSYAKVVDTKTFLSK